jgi:alkylation response protein AidB-like acyl-CoA dehydrogenase
VAAKALQVHGGYGYTQDFAVERLLRDAISLRAATGVTHAATGA